LTTSSGHSAVVKDGDEIASVSPFDSDASLKNLEDTGSEIAVIAKNLRIISERIKYNQYHNHHPDYHYWRTYDHQEIDLLEVIDGSINALECKYRESNTKIPAAFHKAYPTSTYHTVHRNNYLQFITQP
jgi:hypothetical protein